MSFLATFSNDQNVALFAYGYFNRGAGVANMSPGFAAQFVDTWVGYAHALDPAGDPDKVYQVMSAALSLQNDSVADDGAKLVNPEPLWRHAFAIASYLDNGANFTPSIWPSIEDFKQSFRDNVAVPLGIGTGALALALIGLGVAYFALKKG